MVRVVTHADAFFNQTLFIKSAAVFARKKISIDNLASASPKSLNHTAGWLVPVHTDGCNFDSRNWKCDSKTTSESIEFYRAKHVSVVIFLNELSTEGGGEFVFIDPLKSTHTEDSGMSTNSAYVTTNPNPTYRKLSNKHKDRHDPLSTLDNSIALPPRHLVRRALSHQYKSHKSHVY